ncbi:ferritin-like domain-containing protein [Campylobacter sp. 9BO]|uniref:ferritin-like domain-containing protein n=1 Tax=Campylobacter sp. 9BO TaxID=3424759 RepID=UPI003D3464D4
MSKELLNIAYISEKTGEKLYECLAKFGDTFEQILKIRKNGLTLLKNYAQLSKNELDEATIKEALDAQNFEASNTFEAYIFALNYELSLNKNYDNLCKICEDETLRDVFFRLWATSNNEYIASLKAELASYLIKKPIQINKTQEQNFGENILNNYQKNFNDMSEQINQIISGKMDKEQISKLLLNPNFPFFSGLALGALGTQMISKNLKENQDENNTK